MFLTNQNAEIVTCILLSTLNGEKNISYNVENIDSANSEISLSRRSFKGIYSSLIRLFYLFSASIYFTLVSEALTLTFLLCMIN